MVNPSYMVEDDDDSAPGPLRLQRGVKPAKQTYRKRSILVVQRAARYFTAYHSHFMPYLII